MRRAFLPLAVAFLFGDLGGCSLIVDVGELSRDGPDLGRADGDVSEPDVLDTDADTDAVADGVDVEPDVPDDDAPETGSDADVESDASETGDGDADADGDEDGDEDAPTDGEPEIEAEADADDASSTCSGGWLDPSSGLCWQDPPVSPGVNWAAAMSYCDGLDLGGHGPGSWHLPTISELRSIVRGCPATETGGSCGVTDACLDGSCHSSACTGCTHLGGPGTGGCYWLASLGGTCEWYWSSSSLAPSGFNAWGVGFGFSDVSNDSKTSAEPHGVRCARPGP